MQAKQSLWGLLTAAMLGLAAPAQAQEAEPAAEPAAGGEEGGEESGDGEKDKDPMGWFGVGLKLGAGGNGEGEFEVGGVTSTIDSRAGFQLSVPINLGGDGFGWIFEPYLNFASVEGVEVTSTGTIRPKDYGVTTMGLYTGPTINIHIIDPLYVGIGAGLKFGYVTSDAFDMGADVFFRVPVTATYYLLDDIGLVAELGLGYGVTGFAAVPYTDPATGTTVEPDLEFGSALTWDFSVGVRWP